MKQTIRHIFGSTFTVATIFLAAGCSEYNPEEFNGNLTKEEYEKISEYTQNFTLRYGKMDPDHDWGFGELAPKGSKGVKGTRLYIDPNNNEWVNFQKRNDGDGDYVYDFDTKGMTVPGFPSSLNGWYYTQEGIFKSKQELLDWMKANRTYAVHPLGDVTDEEIIYVSNYFRTHRLEKSTGVNLSEFFIQSISRDHDRVSYPDGAWKTLENETLSYGLDQLTAIQGAVDGPHTYNFNAGNTDLIPANLSGDLYSSVSQDNEYMGMQKMDFCTFRTLQCMRNGGDWDTNKSNVTSFKAWSSDDNQWNENYVLVHLEFEGPKSGMHYSGDYLAFDYSFNKEGKKMDPDGYYSNWIVKISPVYPYTTPGITTTETVRVMCEDLGSTNDFDFNDLVFDVYYTYEEDAAGNKSNIQAHITLQAVGGTLPIYIGAQTTSDPTKELHYRMTNTNAKNPINVGAGTTCAPVTFTMSATSTDPNDLDICVGSSDNKATDYIILPSSGNSNLAPQKICVPTTVRWLRESQQIEWGYTKFKDWVNSQKTNPFWNDGINESYLY